MKTFWWNDYIGLPFKQGGHGRSGCDCWGLVRLVHREIFGVELAHPKVETVTRQHIAGVLLTTRDALWEKTNDPRPGDVLTFTFGGHESHVSIVTTPGMMLHVREGKDATIEPYTGGQWKCMLTGIYRYGGERQVDLLRPESGIRLLGCPNPVTMERIETIIAPGQSLAEIIHQQCDAAGVSPELRRFGHAYVDAQYYPYEQWNNVLPRDGQVIVFRMVPGKGGGLQMALSIVIAIAAIVVSVYCPPAGWALTASTASLVGGLSGAAVAIGGMLLMNALFPMPTPKAFNAMQTGAPVSFLSGSKNSLRPYKTIPQVLGIGRMTADYIGKPYTERASEVTNYLRAGYSWGFGPLEVRDIRNGDTPVTRYQDMQVETYQGYSTDPPPSLFVTNTDDVALNITMRRDDNKYVSDWYYYTTPEDTDHVSLEFHMPEGQWCRSTKSGRYYDATLSLDMQVRQLPSGAFHSLGSAISASQRVLQSCSPMVVSQQVFKASGLRADAGDWWLETYGFHKVRKAKNVTIDLWQWYTVSLDRQNSLIFREGAVTDSQYKEPSANLASLLRQQQRNWLASKKTPRLAAIGSDEKLLHYVCVQGNKIVAVQDKRDPAKVTGLEASYNGLTLKLEKGTVNRSFIKEAKSKMSPFTFEYSYKVPRGKYEVRVRRAGKNYQTAKNERYNSCIWRAIRCTTAGRPFAPRKPLARTEMRVRASNQLNGTLDVLNASVASIVKDYDYRTKQWVQRISSNPASLFRHVLQGASIATPWTDKQIDIATMERWHTFCRIQGFSYFSVIGASSATSVYDVLSEVAAAGRATVDFRDGKWTVIIDEPRTAVVQHFTPHNSWGFTGTKVLPDIPHAIRANFVNKEKGYEQDILTVYADGYSSNNANKFEEWSLDRLAGITDPKHVQLTVRYAMAWAKLRPEKYSLFCDIEHIVCTRGDLVRVTNDVALWGLGSGRITRVLESKGYTVAFVLDEPVQMEKGERYTMRVRLGNQHGKTRKLTITPVQKTDLYKTVTFAGTAQDIPAAGDLFQFGKIDAESRECLVESIRPDASGNAELGLVDYSPEIYTLDDGPLPDFESGITLPQELPSDYIASVPNISGVYSNEQALLVADDGTVQNRIALVISVPKDVEKNVTHVQARFRESTNGEWSTLAAVPLTNVVAYCSPVTESALYDVELRFVASNGVFGLWERVLTNYTVNGKTTPPPDILWLSVENKRLYWPVETMPFDVTRGGGYEVRVAYGAQKDWAKMIRIRDGFVTEGQFDISNYIDGKQRTFAVKAQDSGGRQSQKAALYVTTSWQNQTAPLPANLVYTVSHKTLGWPGKKSRCAMGTTGTLNAHTKSTFWTKKVGNGAWASKELFWAANLSTKFFDGTYGASQYVFSWKPDPELVGQDLRLIVKTTKGDLLSVEYGYNANQPYWTHDADGEWKPKTPFWADAQSFAWGEQIFYPLPAVIKTIEEKFYAFRIKLDENTRPVQLQDVILEIDMPDKEVKLFNVSVAAAGVRLPIGGGWTSVKYVVLELVNDGGNAVVARVLDRDIRGPFVQCYDLQGNPTAGVVNAVPVLGF